MPCTLHPPGQVQIQLAPEDVAAIDGLAEMTGFDKNDCLQAYMACDKNADQAANLLFTNPPESDDPPPGAPPPRLLVHVQPLPPPASPQLRVLLVGDLARLHFLSEPRRP